MQDTLLLSNLYTFTLAHLNRASCPTNTCLSAVGSNPGLRVYKHLVFTSAVSFNFKKKVRLFL